jgi:hypothetical protein
MFLLVTGSRDFPQSESWFIHSKLDAVLKTNPDMVMINGGARGADTICLRWAAIRGVPTEVYKAEWSKYGRGAGPKRNLQMVNRLAEVGGDTVMAFVYGRLIDSRGTRSCVNIAIASGFTPNVYELGRS